MRVKLADIEDNLSSSRFTLLPKNEQNALRDKYLHARQKLMENTGYIAGIFSGGQTGADQGALDAALYCEVEYGGWIPKGRKCEKGKIPAKYKELEELDSPEYMPRTEANVVDSDCTLVFFVGTLNGGSLQTVELARKHKRPCLHVDLNEVSRKDAVTSIAKWLHEKCPFGCALNIAGSRESKSPGIHDKVMAVMIDVLREVNPDCRRFYPIGE